jgi:hypothetical protein
MTTQERGDEKTRTELTPQAADALQRLLALRQVTYETNTVTRRAQNAILQRLSINDLEQVSLALAKHQQEVGW